MRAGAGGVWVAWTTEKADHRVALHVGGPAVDGWRSHEVAAGYGLAPPSLRIDLGGRLHLAWHDVYEDSYYLAGTPADLGAPRQAPRKLGGNRYRPVLVPTGAGMLAVHETDYSFLDHVVPDAPERRGSVNRRDARFAWDTCHAPQLALDRHGVPWLFFVDSARRVVFHSRWLGTEWGPLSVGPRLVGNSPRLEDNHLSIERIAVPEAMPERDAGISLALERHGSPPRTELRIVPVPSLRAAPGTKVLFLDLQEAAQIDGLEIRIHFEGEAGHPRLHSLAFR